MACPLPTVLLILSLWAASEAYNDDRNRNEAVVDERSAHVSHATHHSSTVHPSYPPIHVYQTHQPGYHSSTSQIQRSLPSAAPRRSPGSPARTPSHTRNPSHHHGRPHNRQTSNYVPTASSIVTVQKAHHQRHANDRTVKHQEQSQRDELERKKMIVVSERKRIAEHHAELERKKLLREAAERKRAEAETKMQQEHAEEQLRQQRERSHREHQLRTRSQHAHQTSTPTHAPMPRPIPAATIYNPRNHYTTEPVHPPASSSSTATGTCDLPPDLWCDSRESAMACGVEKQCNSLKRKGRPVKITLIYEALCPFCQRFIANQLGSVFGQHRDQFELEMVPWGNSKFSHDGSFSCNHGVKECDANRLQSCVLDVLQVKGALPFIVCFEKHIFEGSVEHAMDACSAFIRSHQREIRHCYETERGVHLQRLAAQKTLSVQPQPIVEVPYLLINDYSPTTENNDLHVQLFPQMLSKWTKIFKK